MYLKQLQAGTAALPHFILYFQEYDVKARIYHVANHASVHYMDGTDTSPVGKKQP